MPFSEEQDAQRQLLQQSGYAFVGFARQQLEEPEPNASVVSASERMTFMFERTHQLKEQANFSGLLDISNLAFQLEGEIRRVQQLGQDILAQADKEVLASYLDSIEAFLDYYFKNSSNAASLEQLMKADEGFQLTPEIKELYLVETREHLTDISTILMNMDARKADPVQGMQEVYRLVHSIKGDSNALGFFEVAEKSHALENLIANRQMVGCLEKNQLELLFAKIEELTHLVNRVEAGKGHRKKGSARKSVVDHPGVPHAQATGVKVYSFSSEVNALLLNEFFQALQTFFSALKTLQQADPSCRDEELDALRPMLDELSSKALTLGSSPLVQAVKSLEKPTLKMLRTSKRFSERTVERLIQQSEHLDHLLQTFAEESGIAVGKLMPEESLNQSAADEDSSQHKESAELARESQAALLWPEDGLAAHDRQIPPEDLEILADVRDIYLEESQELLEVVEAGLKTLSTETTEPLEVIQDIYRAVHTLKGNSNALGVTWVGEAAAQVEPLLRDLREKPETLTPAHLKRVAWEMDLVRLRLQSLLNAPAAATEVDENDFSLLGWEAYEPEANAEIPAEIRDIYILESQELLETVSHFLLELEQETVSVGDAIEEIYRAVHTLKGNSNALGINWIGRAAHDMESFMSELRERPEIFNQQSLERLFRYLETVRILLEKTIAPAPVAPDLSSTLDRPMRTQNTLETRAGHITLEKTPQQVSDAVKRDRSLFDAFEKRISTGSGARKIDLRTTRENRLDKAPAQSQPVQDETIRVAINKVDKIINLADELLINKIAYEQRLSDLRGVLEKIDGAREEFQRRQEFFRPEDITEVFTRLQDIMSGFETQINHVVKNFKNNNGSFSLLVEEIQYNSRTARMLPASNLLNPLRLVVRNTSSKLDKRVRLHVVGEEIELDRLLIEKLKDPLAHILRNALDHGIETQAERKAAGKSAEASVSVAISLSGNNIVFQIHDDGRGIDFYKVRDKAVSLGLLTLEQAAALSDHELSQLLFMPGFSTASQVTDISGRGVGLDVVKNTIDSLNGTLNVVSDGSRGTIFTLSLPVTLTTFDAFLVNIADQTFALPRSAVLSSLTIKSHELADSGVSKAVYFDGAPIKLVSLAQLLHLPALETDEHEFSALVVESNRMRFALLVDQVLESQQMVMKNLGSQLQKVPFVSGATLTGTGEPVVILNISEIIAQLSSMRLERMSLMVGATQTDAQEGRKARKNRKTRVLVVDDSVTTRTLEKNILEAAGFEVFIGKNGLEGKQRVLDLMPELDLVITDVEMPKMTGYEFASWLKKESDYRDTPLIMVTSLASDEFKAKGFSSGIDAYIVKGEFNQKVLLDTIARLLKEAA